MLLEQDLNGKVHFNSALENSAKLHAELDRADDLGNDEKQELCDIYESVFRHREFTGRSSTMYKYEGLGCIYWHMVSKLLLAVCEVLEEACATGADADVIVALKDQVDDIRAGLGLYKSPAEYGAIPLDPYSHTPGFAGVQQPGMTGQVKEDILSRYIELGVSIKDGCVSFDPCFLRLDEFLRESGSWTFLTIRGQRQVPVESQDMAFSLFGTPVIYRLSDRQRIIVHADERPPEVIEGGRLGKPLSRALFERQGFVEKIIVEIPQNLLR